MTIWCWYNLFKVFCFSRNKISRLPSYLSRFNKLDVLRADRNPIEWPPKTIMDFSAPGDARSMKGWIQSIQSWIETESSRLQSDDLMYHEKAASEQPLSVVQMLHHKFPLTHLQRRYWAFLHAQRGLWWSILPCAIILYGFECVTFFHHRITSPDFSWGSVFV